MTLFSSTIVTDGHRDENEIFNGLIVSVVAYRDLRVRTKEAAVNESRYLYYIVHQTVSEHPVQLYLFVFQDILQTSFGTIFSKKAAMWWIQTSTVESS